jgi:hypothetical protein
LTLLSNTYAPVVHHKHTKNKNKFAILHLLFVEFIAEWMDDKRARGYLQDLNLQGLQGADRNIRSFVNLRLPFRRVKIIIIGNIDEIIG